MSDQQVAQWRRDTPGVAHGIHLNNAGAALMPASVLAAMTEHLLLESRIGGYEAAAAEAAKIEAFYDHTARCIGAQARQIAFMSSATEAYNKALSAIPFSAGDVILCSQDDYVSNQIAFLQLSRRQSVSLIRIPDLPEGGVDLEALEGLLRDHRPRLVAITHMPTNSGLIQDAEAIGRLCRKYDSWYLLDACQTFGQLPLDVAALHCDFLSATFRKFMRGPRGAGFLYTSDRVLEAGLEPLFPDLHGATWTAADAYQCRGDAQKFEQWEKPYALVLGSVAAVEYALEVGLEQIRQRVQHLSQLLRDQLSGLPGVINLDRGSQLGGICSFTLPGTDGHTLKQYLDSHHIHSSLQLRNGALLDFDRKQAAWAIRLSPHYYNTTAEIEATVDLFSAYCLQKPTPGPSQT